MQIEWRTAESPLENRPRFSLRVACRRRFESPMTNLRRSQSGGCSVHEIVVRLQNYPALFID
jgi:hypothetical protein